MSLYLFIDGAYFHEAYSQAMEKFYGTVPAINYRDLASRFQSPRRIYYYDAIDRKNIKDETDAQRDARVSKQDRFHAYLNSLPNWHVREGFVSRGRRATRRSQKAVDVQLAVDALEHAVARNMSKAGFILGDLDFEPLLFSLSRFGVEITVFYERQTASEELLEAADTRIQLTLESFFLISDDDFQRASPRVHIQQNIGKPDFPVARRGTWNGRSVYLMRHEADPYYMWAEPGPEGFVRQPSVTVYQTDPNAHADKTLLLFTMTYGGEIKWD